MQLEQVGDKCNLYPFINIPS